MGRKGKPICYKSLANACNIKYTGFGVSHFGLSDCTFTIISIVC